MHLDCLAEYQEDLLMERLYSVSDDGLMVNAIKMRKPCHGKHLSVADLDNRQFNFVMRVFKLKAKNDGVCLLFNHCCF